MANITNKNAYSMYHQFYDEIEGPQEDKATFIKGLIKKWNPDAKELLEVACGTGNILEHLYGEYDVEGLDFSENMLTLAQNKLPEIQFYLQDMSDFKLERQYDAIICIYDSINHLLSFDKWEGLFKSVKSHLVNGGVFIFDMNTLARLEYLADGNTIFIPFNEDYLIMEVEKESNAYGWNLKVFEHVESNHFDLFEEKIYETSFEVDKVKKSLEKYFKIEEEIDQVGRIYFVCRS